GCSSPPGRGVDGHSDRGVGSDRLVREPRIPGSDQRSCNRSCARSQTPGRDQPSVRRLAGAPQTAAFHPSPTTPSRASLPPQKGRKCSPCVRYVLLPIFYKGGSQEKIPLPRLEFFLLPSPS